MVLVRTIIKIAVSSGEQGHRSNSSNNKENHNQLSPSKKIRSLLAIKAKANFA